MKEAERSSSAYFLTLTYAEKIPLSPKKYMTLCKEDVQKFMKRLRKINQEKLKYYCCGEYGTRNKRPHYHIIIFNVELSTIISKKEANYSLLNGAQEYQSPIWGLGHITVGKISAASIGYTLQYISKGSRIPEHKNDDRQKEFSLMSKRMGNNYLSESVINWHKEDVLNRFYVPLKDGKKIALPRYYMDKIFTKEDKEKIVIHMEDKERQRTLGFSDEKCLKEYYKKNLIRINKAKMYDQKSKKRGIQ